MAQELATIAREENEAQELDSECPHCHSLLTISYGPDRARYLCENCDQELSRSDIEREDDDDNIYIVSSYESNRRFF